MHVWDWIDSKFDRWMNGGKGFRRARGRDLDMLATRLNIFRKRYWWIFRESDAKLRERASLQYTSFIRKLEAKVGEHVAATIDGSHVFAGHIWGY